MFQLIIINMNHLVQWWQGKENSYYICHRRYYKDESLSLYCLQDSEVFLDLSQSFFIYSKFKYWKHKEFWCLLKIVSPNFIKLKISIKEFLEWLNFRLKSEISCDLAGGLICNIWYQQSHFLVRSSFLIVRDVMGVNFCFLHPR